MTESTTPKHPVRRGFLLLTVLIVVLFVLNLMYPLAAGWQGTLSGEPGELLYAAGFDGFSDEWQQYEGRTSAQIADGVLRISNNSDRPVYSTAAPIFADFDVSVTTHAVEGELENEGYGIIFRLQEQTIGCNRGFVLACGLAEIPLVKIPARYFFDQQNTGATGYHVFLITNDGYYSIATSNEINELESVTVWHNSNGLLNDGLGAENRIRVVGRGDEFRFYINGEPVEFCIPFAGEQPTGSASACMGEQSFVWRNDTLQQGQLGLVVNVLSVPGIVVDFDNFTVISPEDELQESDQL